MIRSDDVQEAAHKVGASVDQSVKQLRDRRRRTRQRLEEIFSRDVLGSVLVSLAAGKIVEQLVVIAAPSRPARLVAWSVTFAVFVWLFVHWERVAKKAAEVAEAAERSE